MNKYTSAINDYMNCMGKMCSVNENDDGSLTIITPYTLTDGSNIEISVILRNGIIVLSDCGDTIDNLWLRGIDINTKSRHEIINMLIEDHKISIKKGEIKLESPIEDISMAIHNMVQAIYSIDFLIYTGNSGSISIKHC